MFIYFANMQKVNLTKSLVVASKKFEHDDNFEDGKETEIAAQVTLAPDGGWGWVVAVAAFFGIAIHDGIICSFGPLLPDIIENLNVSKSQAALINSLQLSMHLTFGPIASALINKFGFRAVGMAGSIICSLSTLTTYFARNYISAILVYGIINGFGCSLIYISLSLVCGFYFEKLRSIVMPVVTSGTSVGIMTMYQVHVHTVQLAGWRTTILLQAGLYGIIYFLSLTFRPVTTFTIVTEEEGNPTRTVTFLPNIEHQSKKSSTRMKLSAAERAMRAVSNVNFPTAASMVETNKYTTDQAGTSTATQQPGFSRITLKAQSAVKTDQIKKMQSMLSSRNLKDSTNQQQLEILIEVEEEPTPKSCFGRCCKWRSNPTEARPMYRDDVFYDGKIEKLPEYQKSVKELPANLQQTGLEYQLEVSRAVTVDDLKERASVCSTAVRRTLATMLDFSLMKKKSFVVFCLGGLCTSSGAMVPLLFLQARGEANALSRTHSELLVSVYSIANLIGRFLALLVALKIENIYVFAVSIIVAGISTICSSLSFSPGYQYGYCVLYGLGMAGATSLRGVLIADLYGLENLTSAFGNAVMFNGIASMYCAPLAAFLVETQGYETAFYVSGSFITLAGITYLIAKFLRVHEIKKEKSKEIQHRERRRSRRASVPLAKVGNAK